MPVVIGVDAHKYGWVAVAVDETGRRVDACVTEATPIGAQQCQEWASALDVAGGVRRWGIEGAMHDGRALAQHLIRHGAVVVEVPGSATAAERRRSRGREAEKSDVTDALAIARVTLRDGDRLPAIAVDGAPARCHVLSEHRDNLILARTAALNQLYAHVTHTHPAAPRYAFQARRNRPWLRELAAAKPSASTSLTQARTMIVGQLAAMVLMYDEMIRGAGSGTPRTRRPTRAGASEHPWRRSAVRGQTRRDHPSYRPLSDGGPLRRVCGCGAARGLKRRPTPAPSKPTRQSATQPRPARCRRGSASGLRSGTSVPGKKDPRRQILKGGPPSAQASAGQRRLSCAPA